MGALKIVFMGTAELACASLQALCWQDRAQVIGVVTQPDRPKGRDLKLTFSPVKEVALVHSLPVLQPEKARNEAFVEELRRLEPELIVVAAYGQILPRPILDFPRLGCINVHASLLPKYRGAAPIQWAILNAEPETGVTIMKMDAGLDTGDILTQATTPIRPEDNAHTLHDRLAQMGAELLVQTIPDYAAGRITPRPQPAEGSTYARKITKEDGHLDWTQPAKTIWNKVRAFTPWPGAYTFVRGGKAHMLKIWLTEIAESSAGTPGEILQADKGGILVRCGDNALRILELQREGGRRLKAQQFLLGNPFQPGTKLV